MTIETVRQICRDLPDTTEDVKWGNDLVFSVGGKMFVAVDLEPPHSLAFKCSPEAFDELLERDGMTPAPYLARAMWVQEQELGQVLDRRELEQLLKNAYDLVVAKLPASWRPTEKPGGAARRMTPRPASKSAGAARRASRRKK